MRVLKCYLANDREGHSALGRCLLSRICTD